MNGETVNIVLALAGGVGALLRCYITRSQEFRSRTTIGEVLLGVIVGALWSIFDPIQLPENATLLQHAAVVCGASYLAGDLIQNLLPGKLAKVMRAPEAKP